MNQTYIITSITEFINEGKSLTNDKFWNWFGDSKILDESGKPLICYHGSNNSNITTFDINLIGKNTGNNGHYGYGIYFSTNIKEAKTYGDNIYECYIKIENPFTGTKEQILQLKQNGIDSIDEQVVKSIDFISFKDSFTKDSIVYQFVKDIESRGLSGAWKNYIKLDIDRNLYDDKIEIVADISEYTDINNDVNGVPDFILDYMKELNIEPKLNYDFETEQSLHWITDLGNNSKEITDIILQLGYDGIYYGTELVIFNSNQIKSIDNNGNWDINSQQIYE